MSVEHIVTRVAVERIVAGSAVKTIASVAPAKRVISIPTKKSIVTGAATKRVISDAAVEMVVTLSPHEDIVSRLSVQSIMTGAAVDHIASVAGKNPVVAGLREHSIVVVSASYPLGLIAPDNEIPLDLERKRLRHCEAARIGRGHGDINARAVIRAEIYSLLEPQLAVDDLKTIVGDLVAMGVATVLIAGGQTPDDTGGGARENIGGVERNTRG